MSSVFERLLQEEDHIKKNLKEIGGRSLKIFKDNDDYPHWYLSILGPKKSPYEGGVFYIEIKFPKDYPNSKPEVQMRTPIYHPNINNTNGNIRLDYIYKWKNTYNVTELMLAIFYLLSMPNIENSYNKLDNEKAKEFTKKYALENQVISFWNRGWHS